MKTVVIKEFDDINVEGAFELNLSLANLNTCCGCWTCWWKTPGKCIRKDLDEFYHEYVASDKAIFFGKVKKGFVSGDMKNLFDRMIPLFMPYTSISSGESMHLMRYEKYPDIEFYYEDIFISEESRKIYEDYINRVFYHFFSKNISVKPISAYIAKEAL